MLAGATSLSRSEHLPLQGTAIYAHTQPPGAPRLRSRSDLSQDRGQTEDKPRCSHLRQRRLLPRFLSLGRFTCSATLAKHVLTESPAWISSIRGHAAVTDSVEAQPRRRSPNSAYWVHSQKTCPGRYFCTQEYLRNLQPAAYLARPDCDRLVQDGHGPHQGEHSGPVGI